MKLHLPSSFRAALVACMACAATVSAETYIAEGVVLNADKTVDVSASNRFYDGAKGDWGWTTTNITNAAYQIYSQNGKDLSVFGDLAPAITVPEYSMSLNFSNLTSDSKQCWAYTSANMIQYWQTYYGVFANKARTENRNDPVHGLNYDQQYMTQLAGTQSLKLNKLFYDSFENIGSGNGPGRTFGWYLTKENGWGGQKDNTSSPGYFDQYYESYQDTSTYTTTGSLWASSMNVLSDSIKGHFGYTKNADGVWEQTTKGQIIHLELTGSGSHAITCYGFETDANGDITAFYIVNSDDTSYNLEKVYTKFNQTSYGEGQITLYYDEACTQSWRGWTVTGWSSINTPEVLKSMLAEYEKGNLTWMGNLSSWTNTAAVTADVNELPTDETGWMTYAGTGTEHAGYYNTYYTTGRGVEFNDAATSGTVNVAEDITVPSMTVNNNSLTYEFKGEGQTITVDSFSKKGTAATTFKGVNLVAGTATLEGDVTFDKLHVTGTLNAADKRIHANSITLDGDATIGSIGDDGGNHGPGATDLTITGGQTTIQNNWAWTNLKSLTLSDSASLSVGASLGVSGNITSTAESLPASGNTNINTKYCLYVGTEGDASTGKVELAGNISAGAYIKILGDATVTGNVSTTKDYIDIGGTATIGGNLSAGSGSITLNKGGSVGGAISGSTITLKADTTVGSVGEGSALVVSGGSTTVKSSAWTNLGSLALSDQSAATFGASVNVAGNITTTDATGTLAEGSQAGIKATYCVAVGTEGKADTGNVNLRGDISAGAYIKILGDAKVTGNVSTTKDYIEIGGNATIGGALSAGDGSLTVRGNATLGGDVTAHGNITIGGSLTGTATGENILVSTSGTLELGGDVSHADLKANALTLAEGITLDSVNIKVNATDGSLNLSQVEVKGDSSFSSLYGTLTLNAEGVTFVLDASNSLAGVLPSASPLSDDSLTQTSTFGISSSMLEGVELTGSVTLDISYWTSALQESGCSELALLLADDMSFADDTSVQLFDGVNYTTVAPGSGDHTLRLNTGAIPEPATATLSLLALAALATRRRRK